MSHAHTKKWIWGTQGKSHDIGVGRGFLDTTAAAQANGSKAGKWDPMGLKSSHTRTETTDEMKRQPVDWEKVLANHISHEGLISKVHKNLDDSLENN